ncbi:MAG: hypothetical protein EPO06_05070 [Burkholderiaceae bacterium]|nr:MAG: hypothetical protein EPO06_05070 [Burkholderiaceae bacterium]
MHAPLHNEIDPAPETCFETAALPINTAANDHSTLRQAVIDKLFPPTIVENWATLQYRHYRQPRAAGPALNRQAVVAVTDKIILTENQLFADQRKRLLALQQAHRAELHALRAQIDHDEQLLAYERERQTQLKHALAQIRERLRTSLAELDQLKTQAQDAQYPMRAMHSVTSAYVGQAIAPQRESLSLSSALLTVLKTLALVALVSATLFLISH